MVQRADVSGFTGYVQSSLRSRSQKFDAFTQDVLQPPARALNAPMRLPISNVFKGQTSGTGVSGRLCSGVVQVGEKLRVLPGDETAVVKCETAPTGSCMNSAAKLFCSHRSRRQLCSVGRGWFQCNPISHHDRSYTSRHRVYLVSPY